MPLFSSTPVVSVVRLNGIIGQIGMLRRGLTLRAVSGLLERAFTMDGAYLRDSRSGMTEFRERGPQLTRSARALKLWLSLTVFGLDAFKAAIERGIDLAEHAERTLLERDGWDVVSPACLAIVWLLAARTLSLFLDRS